MSEVFTQYADDPAWWQRRGYAWVDKRDYAHVWHEADKESYPLAEYWVRALEGDSQHATKAN